MRSLALGGDQDIAWALSQPPAGGARVLSCRGACQAGSCLRAFASAAPLLPRELRACFNLCQNTASSGRPELTSQHQIAVRNIDSSAGFIFLGGRNLYVAYCILTCHLFIISFPFFPLCSLTAALLNISLGSQSLMMLF